MSDRTSTRRAVLASAVTATVPIVGSGVVTAGHDQRRLPRIERDNGYTFVFIDCQRVRVYGDFSGDSAVVVGVLYGVDDGTDQPAFDTWFVEADGYRFEIDVGDYLDGVAILTNVAVRRNQQDVAGLESPHRDACSHWQDDESDTSQVDSDTRPAETDDETGGNGTAPRNERASSAVAREGDGPNDPGWSDNGSA